jgi:hypothetical protein
MGHQSWPCIGLLLCQLCFSVKLTHVRRGGQVRLMPDTRTDNPCADIMDVFCKPKVRKKNEPSTALNLFGELKASAIQNEEMAQATSCMACGRRIGARLAESNCFEKNIMNYCSTKNHVEVVKSGALACDEVVHLYCSHTETSCKYCVQQWWRYKPVVARKSWQPDATKQMYNRFRPQRKACQHSMPNALGVCKWVDTVRHPTQRRNPTQYRLAVDFQINDTQRLRK